jgi:hypothetical protein
MLSPSLAVVLFVVVTGLLAVISLVWALLRGWLDDDAIASQATVILDPVDLQTERPWETPLQRHERVQAHGPPHAAPPGAFGGAR